MSTLQQNIHTHYTDNPIRWREILTLRRQKGKWFWRVMYGLSAFIMVIPILWGGAEYFRDVYNFTIGALVFANIIAFLLVALRGVLIANDAIQRERRENTWELLMLTGVSRWRLILGKWFGVMRVTAPNYLWLFLVRLGTIFWAIGAINATDNASYSYYDLRLSDFSFAHEAWFGAIALLALFTILEWGLNTALGISTGFFRWKASTSSGIAVLLRVALGIVPVIVTYLLLDASDGRFLNGIYPYQYNDPTYTGPTDSFVHFMEFIFRYTTIFADNGIFSIAMLFERLGEGYEYFNLGTLAGVMTYPVLTVSALMVSNNRAKARGTNSGTYVGSVKPKRKRKTTEKPTEATTVTAQATPVSRAILPGTENIFALDNAAEYRAEVYSYQRRLGRLYLRLQRDEDVRYARISGVSYLEAPASWKGARFDAATEGAYETFRAEKGLSVNSLQAEHLRLYAHAGTPTVRIIGSTIEMLEELPKNV